MIGSRCLLAAVVLLRLGIRHAGFGAYHTNNSLNIQISKEELDCRPCTVFGKGTCRRGDFACMNWLTPEKVYNEIRKAGIV